MQQADYQCHRPHSMNARKCVHAQKPYPLRQSGMNQARLEEEEKKKRGRETGKTEARRLIERKAAQQNKNTSEERLPTVTTPTLLTQLRLTK